MNINVAFEEIKKEISMTNNGKLLKSRLTFELLPYVDDLLIIGKLKRATFMICGDAIRVA